MTDQYTLLFSPDHKQRKVFSIGGDGEIQKTKIHFPRYFRHKIGHVDSLRDLYTKITTEIAKPYAPSIALMRGAFVGGEALENAEKRRIEAVEQIEARGGIVSESLEYPFYKREDGKLFTRRLNHLVQDQPRHWVVFDLDDFRPEGVSEARFDVGNPREWVDAAISQELGDDFVAVDYILQLSSSAGLPKKKNISAHVWFWMAQGMDSAAWKAWLASRTAVLGRKPKVDAGLFQPARVIYIAPPKFIKGAVDPVEAVNGSRWTYVEGDFGSEVHLSEGVIDWEAVDNARFAAEMRGNALVVGDDADAAREAWERPGVVGAWNRAFSMSETIRRFLAQEYRVDDEHGRVTWLRSPSGAVGSCKIVSGNTRMFSTSAGDPMEGYVGSAFDHIEKILFDGDYAACCDWALKIPEVRLELEREASSVFDDGLVGGSDGLGVKPIEVGEIEVSEGVVEPAPARVVTAETIAAEYPMPEGAIGPGQEYRFINHQWWFGVTDPQDDDEEDMGKKGKGKKKKRGGGFVRLWAPITRLGEYTDMQTGEVVVRMKFQKIDRDSPSGFIPVEIDLPREDIRRAVDILFKHGWNFESSTSRDQNGAPLIKYLTLGAPNTQQFYRLPRSGWVENKPIFACPGGEVIGCPDGRYALSESATLAKGSEGTLEGWRETVRGYFGQGVPHWPLGVAMGLVGPLLAMQGLAGGIVLAGTTSRGKTTAGQIAASVWGAPREGAGGTMNTLNATDVALEALAEKGAGTFIGFDEVHTLPPHARKGFAEMLYSIASGKGKSRGGVDGGLSNRPVKEFRGLYFVSMEDDLPKYIQKQTGQPAPLGLSVRFPSVNTNDQNGDVDKKYLAEQAERLSRNCGLAGPEFIRHFIEAGYARDRRSEISERFHNVVGELTGGASGAQGRTATVFGWMHVAAELAVEFGIVPKDMGDEILEAVAWAWGRVAGEEGFSSPEAVATQHLRNYCMIHWGGGIIPVGSDAGYAGARGWFDEEAIYFLPDQFAEAVGANIDPESVARSLRARGLLYTNDPKRLKVRAAPMGAQRGYKIYRLSEKIPNGFGPQTVSEDQMGSEMF